MWLEGVRGHVRSWRMQLSGGQSRCGARARSIVARAIGRDCDAYGADLGDCRGLRIQEPIVELRNVRVHDRRSRNYPRAFEVADCDRVHHLSQHDCRREEWRPLLKAAEIRHAARPGACTWTPNQRDPLVFWCSAPWRLWLLLRHQLRQGRPAANAKLVIGIAEMKLDSLWTQVHLGGHLACRPAAGE